VSRGGLAVGAQDVGHRPLLVLGSRFHKHELVGLGVELQPVSILPALFQGEETVLLPCAAKELVQDEIEHLVGRHGDGLPVDTKFFRGGIDRRPGKRRRQHQARGQESAAHVFGPELHERGQLVQPLPRQLAILPDVRRDDAAGDSGSGSQLQACPAMPGEQQVQGIAQQGRDLPVGALTLLFRHRAPRGSLGSHRYSCRQT
jgi:hypothetical protein